MASPKITLTHLDEPLFDGADATKRDLVDYLKTVGDRIVSVLSGRPLSVVQVRAWRGALGGDLSVCEVFTFSAGLGKRGLWGGLTTG